MIEDIIAKTICGQRVVDQIPTIRHPVFRELLRAEDEDILIPAFVVFDDSECCESLAKADTVCKDAAIILLQLVDDTECCILLEVVEFIPDHAILESSRFIRQDIF